MLKYLDRRNNPLASTASLAERNDPTAYVGLHSNQADNYYIRTRRSRCQVNIALEDFTRIHTQFSERQAPDYIETMPFILVDNERIKFQIRLKPGTHDLHFDALYRGTDPSAVILMEVYLLDRDGRKYPFDYSRKIDIQLGHRIQESLNNFLYDRDELERKREKLFQGDKLVICFDLNATWCELSDKSDQSQSSNY